MSSRVVRQTKLLLAKQRLMQLAQALGLDSVRQAAEVEEAMRQGVDVEGTGLTWRDYAMARTTPAIRRRIYAHCYGHQPVSHDKHWREWKPSLQQIVDFYGSVSQPVVEEPPPKPVRPPRAKPKTDLMTEYLAHYVAETPNDISNLQTLITFQELLARTREELRTGKVIEGGRPRDLSPQELDIRIDIARKLNAECVALEKALAIDRSTRERRAAESSDPDRWNRIIAEATAFLETKISPIMHCNILIAWWWPSFDAEEISPSVAFTCPRCEKQVSMPITPTKADLTKPPRL